MVRHSLLRLVRLAALALAITVCGCATPRPAPVTAPSELQKNIQPPYTIEPPDLIQIDLLSSVPKPPYRVRPLDVLAFSIPNVVPEASINAPLTVDPDGTVNLGSQYPPIPVAGKTLAEVRQATEEVVKKVLRNPVVNVSLVQTRGSQQIRGPHLVRADGTVGLGVYGSVSVVGLTIAEAKKVIDAHLGEFFLEPDVSVDVVGYNSKVYYVVFDYGGAGQQVVRLPHTGNETVLDAISQTNGLPTVADGNDVWVSRRGGDVNCPPQVLTVDWPGVVEQGDSRTNYQVMPGDRVYVKANRLVKADVRLARILSPIERVFGVVLLGSSTVNSIRTNPNNNNNGNLVP